MIGKFFRWLFGGCEHDWKDEERHWIVDSETKARVAEKFIQKCEKCGYRRAFTSWI